MIFRPTLFLAFSCQAILTLVSETSQRQPQERRRHTVQPVGADIRGCIIGFTNAGKSGAFNLLSGGHSPVTPRVFETRDPVVHRRQWNDERFKWLAKQFGNAHKHAAQWTFVDTPALVSDLFPDMLPPWHDELVHTLASCDVVFHVISHFRNDSVERWVSKKISPDYYPDGVHPNHHAVQEFFIEHDRRKIDGHMSRQQDSLRNLSLAVIKSRLNDKEHDNRLRYNLWTSAELDVLRELGTLSHKPIVCLLNFQDDEFEIVSELTLAPFAAPELILSRDPEALVLGFTGASSLHPNASALIENTMEHLQLCRIFTANDDLVAMWMVRNETTLAEVARLLNATLDSEATTVEVVNVGSVMQKWHCSIESARSAGEIHRVELHDFVKDGDLLFLTPNVIFSVTDEPLDADNDVSVHLEANSPQEHSRPLPTAMPPSKCESQRNTTAWFFATTAFVLFSLLAALIVEYVARDRSLLARLRLRVDMYQRILHNPPSSYEPSTRGESVEL